MSQTNIAAQIEAALLRPDATEQQVRDFCNDARQHAWGAVCVNPAWVELARNVIGGAGVRLCTVASFPFGAGVASTKNTETRLALEAGANEVNMVLNIGALKGGDNDKVQREIVYVLRSVRNISSHARLKVIVECPLLTTNEKAAAARIIAAAGADWIMTGTGFAGASTVDDIRALRAAAPNVPICAEGASNAQQARDFLAAGATRLSSARPTDLVS